MVNELIDSFYDRGQADLVREVTFNFPAQVIARILGLPRSDYPRFQRWAIELTSVAANWERGVAASEALRDYFAGVMEERRSEPGDDLISELVRVEVDGTKLTRRGDLLLPPPAPAGRGGDHLPGHRQPPLRASSTTGPSSTRSTTTGPCSPRPSRKSLRWEPPVTVILRRATKDTELAGVPIEEGADVALLLGAANRDERKYTDPDTYDMFREVRQHVGFGFGVHVCLGMHLARMESRVAINTLFDRLGPFTLDPAAEPPHIEGLAFRSPLSLPVVWPAG